MSLASSGGFALRPPPGLRPCTPLGDFRSPDPLFRIPFMKMLDPPLPSLLPKITYNLQSANFLSRIFFAPGGPGPEALLTGLISGCGRGDVGRGHYVNIDVILYNYSCSYG